jgi:hypothetical protein
MYVKAFTRAVAIVPHASTNIVEFTSGILVGVAGDVAVVFQDDSVAIFKCIAGQILPVCAKRVNAVGTTATNLVALYYA